MNTPTESRIMNRLYMNDHIKFHTILLNELSETLKVVLMLLCMFTGLSRITSTTLIATSVPELMNTPVLACMRVAMSFVLSLMNIMWVLCLDC